MPTGTEEKQALDYLVKSLLPYLGKDGIRHTRAHPLALPGLPEVNFFCKREDEVGFASGGTKARKFDALIPFLHKHSFQDVIIIGGAFSNNVLALTQTCIEQGFKPYLFLRGNPPPKLTGNHLLTRLFVSDQQINYIARGIWENVLPQAQNFAETLRAKGRKVYIVTEGSAVAPALAGMLGLFIDILRNEVELNLNFQHIILDAGTGATAAALLLADAFLGTQKHFYINLTAGSVENFQHILAMFHFYTLNLLQTPVPFPQNYKLFPAKNTFGYPSKVHFEHILKYARQYGILTDPVYTANLFQFAETTLAQERLTGNVLVIHSGGLSALTGFETELKNVILTTES